MDVRLHPLEYTQRTLPGVCAATGERAAWELRMEIPGQVNPLAFILLFFGPIGWILLLFVLGRSDGTYVDVPVSQQVMDNVNEKRRRWYLLLATMVASTIVFAVMTGNHLFPGAWMAFLPVLGLAAWVGSIKTHHIRARLDSAGLVTIKNVHPFFASAVADWRDNTVRLTPRP